MLKALMASPVSAKTKTKTKAMVVNKKPAMALGEAKQAMDQILEKARGNKGKTQQKATVEKEIEKENEDEEEEEEMEEEGEEEETMEEEHEEEEDGGEEEEWEEEEEEEGEGEEEEEDMAMAKQSQSKQAMGNTGQGTRPQRQLMVTHARDRTYIQEKDMSGKKVLVIEVSETMSTDHSKIIDMIKNAMEKDHTMGKEEAKQMRAELLGRGQ